MQINGYSNSLDLFGIEETERIKKIRQQQETLKSEMSSTLASGDRVSISARARELSAAFQARDTDSDAGTSEKRIVMPKELEQEKLDAIMNKAGTLPGEAGSGTTASKEASGSDRAGGGSGSGESVEGIKKQIEQLQAKIQTVASSDMPEQPKQAAIQAYEAQIQELTKQMAELEQSQSDQG